jgi:hypothetical protein
MQLPIALEKDSRLTRLALFSLANVAYVGHTLQHNNLNNFSFPRTVVTRFGLLQPVPQQATK